MPKFSIVEFTDSNDVAVVATSWLSTQGEKTFCYCPPPSQLSRAAEKCIPVDHSWKVYECRQLYSSHDYSKARLKLRDAELTSNLESEVEAHGKHRERRKRQSCQLYASNSESDPEFSAPTVGSKSVSKKLCSVPLPPCPPQLGLSTSSSVSLPRFSDASETVSAVDKCILTKLEEIKDFLVEVKNNQVIYSAKVDTLLRSTGLCGSMEDLPGDLQLPLTSTNDLITLEKRLEDSQLRHTLIRNIGTIGGTSVKEASRRILRHMMTNACAKDLNWKGRGGKIAFAETKLRTVIVKAVRQNPITAKASDDEVEKQIKDWLKFANERDGRRKERDVRKRTGSSTTQTANASVSGSP